MSTNPPTISEGPGWHFLEESSSVVILRVNAAGTIVDANQCAKTLFGEPLDGQPWDTILLNLSGQRTPLNWLADQAWPKSLNINTASRLPQTLQVTVETDGADYLLFGEVNAAEQAHLSREVLELNHELGNLTRELGLKNAELDRLQHHLEDMVQERTAELSLAKEAAEAANGAKTIFLSNMSHELRTPMNGVMGMIDLVLRRATEPKQIDWLNKGKSSAQHLMTVINAILDISKIESDRMTLEEKNFSLSQTIDDVLHMQESASLVKGLSLCSEVPSTLPDLLCGDAMRLKQILLNFIGNAIKFSDQGRIIVRAQAVEQDVQSLLLRIEVADQGIGIDPGQQERLFHAFTQADDSINRKYGGSGLGLVISKQLALLMGGDAGVDSTLGVGSTFWATMRFRKNAEAAGIALEVGVDAETIIRKKYFDQRILVVDDEPLNREVAQFQLESADLVADAAADGAEAIALAGKTPYAAIFMDMQMPNVDGLEATRKIRQIPGYQHTPIIAMTANAFNEDKALCLEAGMDDFLFKPFTPDVLFETLLRSLNRRDI